MSGERRDARGSGNEFGDGYREKIFPSPETGTDSTKD
jgi:hypothetical protein